MPMDRKQPLTAEEQVFCKSRKEKMHSKRERLVSPFAEAAFPHLSAPDTKFDAKGKYSVNQVLDPNTPDHARFLKKIEEIGRKAFGARATLPLKDQTDKYGNPSGCKLVRFASSRRPKIFDNHNQPLPEDTAIGQGSMISVSATVNPYQGIGGRSGVSFYLDAVKVRTIVEPFGGNAESYGFAAAPPDEEPTGTGEGGTPQDKAEASLEGGADLPF